jgi:GT2 family glycosyltransferase
MREVLRSVAPSLCVVVPATDEAPHLDRCLTSIAAAADGPDQVVVIDQPRLSVVDARNEGAARTGADVLVFIDSDVLVHNDAFTRIRAAFARDPGLSAVVGAYDESPAAGGAISGFRNLLHHAVGTSAPGPLTTFWTGLGAVRSEAFASAGGFDDELRWPRDSGDPRDFMADVAFGVRLAEAGHRIELDPRIQGTHLKRWTLSQMVYTDFLLRGVPWVRLLLRRRDAPVHLNLGWRHRISALVSLFGTISILRRRPRPAAAMAAALVILNRPFYALLLRRRGPAQATAGIAAHMLHHLTSLASICCGLAIHLSEQRRPSAPAGVEFAAAEAARSNGASHSELVRMLPADAGHLR